MMDKPLDFSMNSGKEKNKNSSENEIKENPKGKRDASDVCKEKIAEIDANQNGNKNDNFKIENATKLPKGNLLGC